MDEDPVFYKKFSQLIEDAIKSFTDRRINEAQYLLTVNKIRTEFVSGAMEGTPSVLSNKPEARAFYNIVKEIILKNHTGINIDSINEKIANAGIGIAGVYSKFIIRDWK